MTNPRPFIFLKKVFFICQILFITVCNQVPQPFGTMEPATFFIHSSPKTQRNTPRICGKHRGIFGGFGEPVSYLTIRKRE